MAEQNKKQLISKDKLLEAGVYFGHKKDRWNPKMKPYIATTKKGTHILDVDKTKRSIEFAYSLIQNFAKKGASFVFVGTRKQAKEAVKSNALRTNSYYVTERWLGGTLTNSRTIFQRVKRMSYLEKLAENNFENYTKKEGVLFAKELAKLQKNLSGIRKMTYKPNIMIVADPKEDEIAVKEAQKLGVKVIGIIDTNNDPSSVDVAIPANDDSVKSVTLVLTLLADAIAEAKGGQTLYAYKSDDEIVLPEELKKERPARRPFNNRRFNDRRPFNNNSRFSTRPAAKKEGEATTTRPAATSAPAAKATVAETKTTTKDSTDLSELKVEELKDRLKEKGLPVSGKKSELIERLQGE